jgi:hypothetical protein
MNPSDLKRQLEIVKELAELSRRQLEQTENATYLGHTRALEDAACKRSERIRALRRELAMLGIETRRRA